MTGNFSLSKHWKLIVFLAVAIAALVVYASVNPENTWWMPKCPVHLITGLDCPGCGSQRALHSLLNGNFAAAFHYNAFLILLLPFLIFLGVVEINRKKWPKTYKKLGHPAIVIPLFLLVVAWTVWRNIP